MLPVSGQRSGIVDETPLLLPVDVSSHAFSDEIAPTRRGQWREMRIGKMGEREHQSGSSPLRTADQYAGDKNQCAANHNLERSPKKRRVHEAHAYPRYHRELDDHDDD